MFGGLFKHTTVLLTPPGHGLFHGRPLKLEDIASWRLILMAPESLLGQSVGQAYESRGLSAEVAPALDNIESMKRYVEIGMGIGIRSGFDLHDDDHHRLGLSTSTTCSQVRSLACAPRGASSLDRQSRTPAR